MATIIDKIPEILLKLLASTYTAYYQAQSAHWNVTGKNFLSLHSFYGDIYAAHAVSIDLIAERIRQYGVEIPDDLRVLLALANVKPRGSDAIEKLSNIHSDLNAKWNDVASVSDSAGDAATTDMAGKLAGENAKFAWMLKSITE